MAEAQCADCGKAYGPVVNDRFAGVCPGCLAHFALKDEPVEAATQIDVERPLLKPGASFRGFVVEDQLGAGGMGVVYRARQEDLGRSVALKVLSPAIAAEPEFAQRFTREAKALGALSHPNIVHVYEYGREGDFFFLVMELVDGVSLRELMNDRRLAPAEALRIVPQVCEALEYAHLQGVVHRDIKPENILVDRSGRVKIADFGLAKMSRDAAPTLTRTDVAMGTPQYMAPEQYENMKDVDHRADIYSLGVVLYELLTGELPVGRFEPPSHHAPVDVRLDEIVLKTLEKRPDRRYQRAAQVKTDLDTVVARGEGVLRRPNLRLDWAALGSYAVAGLLACIGDWALVACGVLGAAAACAAAWDAGRTRTGARLAWLLWPPFAVVVLLGAVGRPARIDLAWSVGMLCAGIAAACAGTFYILARRAKAVEDAPFVRAASSLSIGALIASLLVLSAFLVLLMDGFNFFDADAMRRKMGTPGYAALVAGMAAAMLASIVAGFMGLHRSAHGASGGKQLASWAITIASLLLPCVVPTTGGRVVGTLACLGCLTAVGKLYKAAQVAERVRFVAMAPWSVVLVFASAIAAGVGASGLAQRSTAQAAIGFGLGGLFAVVAIVFAVASVVIIVRSRGARSGLAYAILTLFLVLLTGIATVAALAQGSR